MIRTQVYLSKDLYDGISLIAKQEKKPSAQVLRELLTESIRAKVEKQNAGQALKGLAKLGEKLQIRGPKDLSTNVDKYLYEE